MFIDRVLVLQKRIIRQMFILKPMIHRKPYIANAPIFFINNLFSYQLYLLAYKIHYMLPVPRNIACLLFKPCTFVTHGSDINFIPMH